MLRAFRHSTTAPACLTLVSKAFCSQTAFQSTSSLRIKRSDGSKLRSILDSYTNNPTQALANALAVEAMSEHHRDLLCRSVASKFGTTLTLNTDSISDQNDRREAIENNTYLAFSNLAEIKTAYLSMSPNTKSSDIHHAEEILPGGFVTERIVKEFSVRFPYLTSQDTTEAMRFVFSWSGQRTPIDMGLNACYLKLDIECPENLSTLPSTIASQLSPVTIETLSSVAKSTVTVFDRHEDCEGDRDSSVDDEAQAVLLAIKDLFIASHSTEFPFNNLTMREFSWWISFMCAHPSNWAFDRVIIELDFAE